MAEGCVNDHQRLAWASRPNGAPAACEDRDRHPGLVAEPGDAPVARIEVPDLQGLRGEVLAGGAIELVVVQPMRRPPAVACAAILIQAGDELSVADGGGYAFLADQTIALDALNPQVAARMARAFDRWKKFDQKRQAEAKAALERIRDSKGLSRDVAEIVTKALA